MIAQSAPNPAERRFRPDIEGLRAVAILAVVLCHAGIPFLAGGYVGVDVFFVISGFLITGLLLAELESDGGISLTRFYARRAKRLLPLSAVLLASVGIASLVLFSPLRSVEVSGDIISSAIYTANWHFAAQSVDYFAQDSEPSPVLHLWSLAIEEQFYLLWPTLLLTATWFHRRRARSVRPVLWAVLAIIVLGSLLLGIRLTDDQPTSAYFSTFGRAWELGLGAMLALQGTVRIPRATAAAIGWLGLAAILYAILAFDASTPFPGTAALVPTVGAALLILSGSVFSRAAGAPAGPLSISGVRYVGRISYSWYLWHWPTLVFAAFLWGPLSVAAGIAAVSASLVPAVITHHLIEGPVRRSRALARVPQRSLLIGAGCMALAAGTGLILAVLQPSVRTAPLSEVKGARALPDEPTPQRHADALRPTPTEAASDKADLLRGGCLVGIEGTNSNRCLYGDPNGEQTVILFGDSHAMQFFPALEELAKTRHWRLIALTKAECPPAEMTVLSEIRDQTYEQCDAWREKSLRDRVERSADSTTVVISSDTAYIPLDRSGGPISTSSRSSAMVDGYISTLERIRRYGLRTIVINDTPRSPRDVPSCVSEHLSALDHCAFPNTRTRSEEFGARAAEAVPGVHLIDVNSLICPDELCRGVIGNALVYQDNTHLTATFVRSLRPALESDLSDAGI